jgi:integrase
MRGRVSAAGVYGRIRTLAKRAGIPGISPHDLRRSYVSDLLDRKVDLATVQALVGHSDPVTTARYDRRPARARAEAVEVLSVPEGPARAEGPA